MRVLNCLAFEHDLSLVLLAVAMCLAASHISITLFRRALTASSASRLHWILLAAVTGGAGIWATHFIAMLGYQVDVPIRFDGTLTILSVIVAVFGIAIGLGFSLIPSKKVAAILGGGAIGLAIAAMHYTGMFAYRAQGVIEWLPEYVIASVVISSLISMLLVYRLKTTSADRRPALTTALLAAAVVTLHFTGMAGFVITPLPGFEPASNAQVFTEMAAAIALVALLILGSGVSTHFLERQTYSKSQDELAHIAMHDSLTKLANRHHFTETLHNECARLSQPDTGFGLLIVDLDRFKPVNDTLGHPAGDRVLRKVADRLRHAVRSVDLVARIGGDEFAVIVKDTRDLGQIERIADRIVEILGRPILINGNVVELGGSVGIALAPQHGRTVTDLVQHADVALYTAKHDGRERHSLFKPELMDRMKNRRALEADLRRACMREDFTVVYQPVFEAASNRLTSAEALLRWTTPDRGEVSPDVFIPVAEELGLVNRIGTMVLERACYDASGWPEETSVAVNISPVQLVDPRLPQTVNQVLQDTGLAPHRLELEITETALLGNDEVALRTLTRLRDLGVRISLDDFGTGYSSLSYLHRFPIDRLKIDKSFIQRLPDDAGSASIVRAIAQLGASLELQITAEGIETEDQYSFIAEHGCQNLQGFLFSKPLPLQAFRELLEAKSRTSAA